MYRPRFDYLRQPGPNPDLEARARRDVSRLTWFFVFALAGIAGGIILNALGV